MNAECPIFEELCMQELKHKPRYTDEFYSMTEDDQDDIIEAGEDEDYIADQKEEDKFTFNLRTEKGKHLASCSDPHCKTMKYAWLQNKILRGFIIDK